MTTLQPRLVRADTLDLQSHNAPSAKDHTRSPTFVPYSHGPTGPHHREALRNAEESAYSERKSSPRLSGEESHINSVNHAQQYDSTDEDGDDEQQDGPNDAAHNDGDYDESSGENEDDLEDDLLDKISSSPSIEDGKYSPFIWPPRVDSVEYEASPASSISMPTRGNSSPTIHSSIIFEPDKTRNAHSVSHHLSESLDRNKVHLHSPYEMDSDKAAVNGEGFGGTASIRSSNVSPDISSAPLNIDDISHYLFPVDDPLLDDDLADCTSNDTDGEWVDEGEPWYEAESSSDDDSDDFQFSNDPRFLDSGWGGECLRDIEDIDFEFVYALHTFVATVEGQANATKGDTMVLLDDSNSYWWLVRVVKDGSIGYLPAEHIETPTERLARLNKHRNIDLSASMLGDNPEKSKNPLKKAMRRRNAKTVAFTAPTYYEPSEVDYSSEDEDEQEGAEDVVDNQQESTQQTETDTIHDIDRAVEQQDSIVIVNGTKTTTSEDQVSLNPVTAPVQAETPDNSVAQAPVDETLQRSRNGVVRNTDSFFKDESVETKKISLTPRLLRNDTDTTANGDQDLRSKTSADTFDKVIGPEEKPKEKEKKEKKKGMLSGLFKRKDKSAKNSKSDLEDEKVDDLSRDSQSKESSESINTPQSPDRKSGKLQKPQSAAIPANKNGPIDQASNQAPTTKSPLQSATNSETVLAATDSREAQNSNIITTNQAQHSDQLATRAPTNSEKRSIFAPITTVLKSSPSASHDHESTVKPVYSKRAKERFAIDGSDSEDDHTPTMSQTSREHRTVSPVRESQLLDPRSDSAMDVSPVDHSDTDYSGHTPPRTGQTANHLAGVQESGHGHIHGTPQSDTASTSKPSPSLATHTPSTSRSTPTWSDASLRSYMESDQDVRDLLIIVHDKSNVIPVGPDHPLMGGLFMTERTRLAEMQTQLDTMLTTWMSRKSPGLLVR